MSQDYEIIEVKNFVGDVIQHVVIPNGDGFTSMLKTTYDEMQANANKL